MILRNYFNLILIFNKEHISQVLMKWIRIHSIIYFWLLQTPAVVSLALPTDLQTPVTKFCLEQRSHGEPNHHVWAMDFMQLLPVLPGTHTHLAQFSINLGCGSFQPANRCDAFHLRAAQRFIANMLRLHLSWSFYFHKCESGVFYQPRSLLVSAPHRVSARALCWTPPTSQHHLLLWQLQRVRNLCSFLCIPPPTSNLNVSISFTYFSRWTRISIPLPNAALTDVTRFRWKQSGTVTGSMWAIDNG